MLFISRIIKLTLTDKLKSGSQVVFTNSKLDLLCKYDGRFNTMWSTMAQPYVNSYWFLLLFCYGLDNTQPFKYRGAVSLKNHKGISSGLFVLKAWSSRNTSRGSSKCTERTLVTTIVKMKSPLWSLLPCVSIEGPIQILGKSTHPGCAVAALPHWLFSTYEQATDTVTLPSFCKSRITWIKSYFYVQGNVA